jgi:hypothetical protein
VIAMILVVALWCRSAVRRSLAGVAAEPPVFSGHMVCIDARSDVEDHVRIPLIFDSRELGVVNAPELTMLAFFSICSVHAYVVLPVRVFVPGLNRLSHLTVGRRAVCLPHLRRLPY